MKPIVNNKLSIAYEKESSVTTRITVKDYAELFQEVPLSQINAFFDKVISDLLILGTNERRYEFLKCVLESVEATR